MRNGSKPSGRPQPRCRLPRARVQWGRRGWGGRVGSRRLQQQGLTEQPVGGGGRCEGGRGSVDGEARAHDLGARQVQRQVSRAGREGNVTLRVCESVCTGIQRTASGSRHRAAVHRGSRKRNMVCPGQVVARLHAAGALQRALERVCATGTLAAIQTRSPCAVRGERRPLRQDERHARPCGARRCRRAGL
jgi:hypothetical protein